MTSRTRALRVTHDGDISEVAPFGNIVPTGLGTHGNTIYMAEAERLNEVRLIAQQLARSTRLAS